MYFAAHEIDLNPKVKKDAYCDKGQFCSDLLIFFFFAFFFLKLFQENHVCLLASGC